MKPSFLKYQKSVKALCKCLIKRVEKGASSQNDALMKKGLRPANYTVTFVIDNSQNDALMKKGLRLLHLVLLY